MNISSTYRIAGALLGILASFLFAAAASGAEIWQGDNRFGLNATLGFNIKAEFKNLQAAPDPGPLGEPAWDRFYDNGFVRIDISGNAGEKTWFWSYHNDAVYDANANAIVLSSTALPTYGRRSEADGDPQLGTEFSYARCLFRIGNGEKPILIVGAEFCAGITDLYIREGQSFSGNAVTTVDSFGLGGNEPWSKPFAGTFTGLDEYGQPKIVLLDSIPNRAFASSEAMATIASKLDGQLYSFKLGPCLEFPFCQAVSFSLGGGLALVGANTEYSVHETVTVNGTSQTQSGKDSAEHWLTGGYVKGALAIRIAGQWQGLAGVQYQDVGGFSQTAGNYRSRLDLGSAVFVSFGVGCSF